MPCCSPVGLCIQSSVDIKQKAFSPCPDLGEAPSTVRDEDQSALLTLSGDMCILNLGEFLGDSG